MSHTRPAHARSLAQRQADEDNRIRSEARARSVIEDAEFLARTGVAIYDAPARLGFTSPRTLDKYLRRWKRPDLIASLNANNRPGIPTGRTRPTTTTQEARSA